MGVMGENEGCVHLAPIYLRDLNGDVLNILIDCKVLLGLEKANEKESSLHWSSKNMKTKEKEQPRYAIRSRHSPPRASCKTRDQRLLIHLVSFA